MAPRAPIVLLVALALTASVHHARALEAPSAARRSLKASCNGPPAPPGNVQALGDSPTSITVKWVSTDKCIERFEVTYALDGVVAPRSLEPRYVTEKSVTLTGLQPSSTYNIVVAALSKNGQRSTVTTRGGTLSQCPSPVMGPVQPIPQQTGPKSAKLSWQTPDRHCIAKTEVTYKSSGTQGPVVTIDPSKDSYTWNDLTPGRNYVLSVRFIGKDGKKSEASTAGISLPNACVSPPVAPVQPIPQQVGPKSAKLSWSTPDRSCLKATELTWKDQMTNTNGPVVKIDPSQDSYTWNDLTPGRNYILSARFIGKDGSKSSASTAGVSLPNNSQGGTVVVGGR